MTTSDPRFAYEAIEIHLVGADNKRITTKEGFVSSWFDAIAFLEKHFSGSLLAMNDDLILAVALIGYHGANQRYELCTNGNGRKIRQWMRFMGGVA